MPNGAIDLRDYFAGQALAALVQVFNDVHDQINSATAEHPAFEMPGWEWNKRAALLAYRYADAMLAERAKANVTGRPARASRGRTTR